MGFNDMRKRPSHATAMSKELTPVHTNQGRKSRWPGGSANQSPRHATFSNLCRNISALCLWFLLRALYYAGSFFKVKFNFFILIFYQHENHHNVDRSDSFLH